MVYFLKKSTPSKKGLYLQIYQSFYVPNKGKRNKSFQAVGYVNDLKAQGIDDPISYAQSIVDKLNEDVNKRSDIQIGDTSSSKNVGYFLLKAMIDTLDVDRVMNIMTQNKHFRFKVSDFVRAMIYSQISNPGSKLKASENVIPNLYNIDPFSYDQILDGIEYIGLDYAKYIELFNHQINELWPRDTSVNFFDCTNYFFEIDSEDELRQKGPSKEQRHDPIIGQALLLDANQLPIGMMMYPGNKSEKPYLRKLIEDTKSRYDVNGKIIQVADKGLNCARNIYAAVKEASDGYIFSKSVHGKNLSNIEKEWVLLDDNNENKWINVLNSEGKVMYRYKECIDKFTYHCYLSEEDEEETEFTVKEKRVVTYNPSLARKQRIQINKQVEKAKSTLTIKKASKEDFGDAAKYIQFEAKDKNGKKVKIKPKLINQKIEEDLALAGYNLLVTSETNMKAEEIYKAYHGLWRIEESFKIMKSYLEARPVFLQKEESIYGHFLICYLSLVVLRLLELKVFEDELSVNQIVEFIRGYCVTDTGEGIYINNATKSKTFLKIKEKLGLAKLGNLYLKKRDIDLLLKTEF